MLARSPSFVFTAGDVEAIVSETGLIKAQVRVWADLFRYRYETEKERKDFLESDGVDKVRDHLSSLGSKIFSTPRPFSDIFLFFQANSVKMSRYFITCFNVTPDFATNFKFQKSKGQGEFGIKYMEAVFNKEAESGEFFIEFEDYVWEHKLIESFQSQGAGQVTTITFANNDGGDSAANALVRILKSQKKTQDVSHRGTCPPALLTKVKAKQAEAERQDLLDSAEFKEKSDAAMKESLAAQVVKLEGIDNKVQSQGVVMEDIKHGVCNVIPDYQNENKSLKEALKHQRWLCDVQESKTAAQTTKVNRLNEVLVVRDAEILSLQAREDAHLKRDEARLNRIKELEGFLELFKSIENVKQIALMAQEDRAFFKEELAFTRAERAALRDAVVLEEEEEEERAAKRPRV
jgi:hypothetical protein